MGEFARCAVNVVDAVQDVAWDDAVFRRASTPIDNCIDDLERRRKHMMSIGNAIAAGTGDTSSSVPR